MVDDDGAGVVVVVVVVVPRRLRSGRRVVVDGAAVVVVTISASVTAVASGAEVSSAELGELRREDIWTARTVVGSGPDSSGAELVVSLVGSVIGSWEEVGVARALTMDMYWGWEDISRSKAVSRRSTSESASSYL